MDPSGGDACDSASFTATVRALEDRVVIPASGVIDVNS